MASITPCHKVAVLPDRSCSRCDANTKVINIATAAFRHRMGSRTFFTSHTASHSLGAPMDLLRKYEEYIRCLNRREL